MSGCTEDRQGRGQLTRWSAALRTARWAFLAAAVCAISATATAQEAQPEAAQAAGEESSGIVNWFSWDYGPNAKEPSHRGWPPPFGFALINFGIFAVILYRLAGQPLRSFVADRHDRLQNELDEAARLRAEAEARLKEYGAKLAGLDQEIDQLLATIRQEAEGEKQRLIETAEAEAKRIRADADRQIAVEIDRARRELRESVVGAAVQAADQILRREIGADDQQRMAERYVAHVEQVPSAAVPAKELS